MAATDYDGGTLLTGATAAVNGAPFALLGVATKYTMQVSFTGGTFTTLSAKLQGSIDGVNWYDLAVSSAVASGDTVFAVDKPASVVRASIATYVLATGTPAVTVSFASTN